MKKLLFLCFISAYALQIEAADSESTFGPIKKTLSQIYWESRTSTNDDDYPAPGDSATTAQASKAIYTPWYPLPAPTMDDEARFFSYMSKTSIQRAGALEKMAYLCPFCRSFGSNFRTEMGAHIAQHFEEKHAE